MSDAEWMDLFGKCSTVEEATPWWKGALMNCIPSENCTQALDEDSNAKVCGWVYRAVPPSLRREGLSFTHHKLVAGYTDHDLINELLSVAESRGFTTRQFIQYLKAFETASKGEEPTEPTAKAPMDKQAALHLARSAEGRTWQVEDTQALAFYLGV
tara:strand:- start:168 stop:635 length:468 start_codon:yes stop_codon:yes gene_type:complete